MSHASERLSLSDLLRNAVQEAICASVVTREKYPDAVFSFQSEMPIPTYCQRITSSSFWGGESELLVLVTMLKVPVAVYLPQGSGAYPTGFARLVTYGEKFAKTKSGKERQPVKLLFNGSNQCVPAHARARCQREAARADARALPCRDSYDLLL